MCQLYLWYVYFVLGGVGVGSFQFLEETSTLAELRVAR